MRESILMVVVEQMESNLSRLSPGDRMIMSEACKQMNDAQLERAINAGLAGMALVAGGPAASIITIASLILTLFG